MATVIETGRPLYVIQYTRLWADPNGRREVGPIWIVGTELTCLGEQGPSYRVRAPDDLKAFVFGSRVTPLDPRVFFTIPARSLRGYLVGGMYDDSSGGSTTELLLDSRDGLGQLHLQTDRVRRIELDDRGVATVELGDGARFAGALVRAWLVASGVRIQLTSARSLVIERA